MISADMNLFCEGWLWYVLCVVYNFSGLRLFCTIISYIDTSKVERRGARENGVTVLLLCGLKCFTCLSSAGVTFYLPCK